MSSRLSKREIVSSARAQKSRAKSLPPSSKHQRSGTDRREHVPTIERMALIAIRPYRGNPRTHDSSQIGRIAASIQSYGWMTPIVVDAEGTIIAGHARFEAARQLGLVEVPVIRADHLSPAEVRAYRLADNRLAEDAGWDQALLRVELAELVILERTGEIDVSLTGFSTAEVDVIITGDPSATDPAEAAESVELPPPGAKAVSRLGDLWLFGRENGRDRHRLLCGNALEAGSYAVLLVGDDGVRLVFTDHPYNVPVVGHVRTGQGGGHREFAMATGEMSEAEFIDFLAVSTGHAARACVDGALLMLFMDAKHQFELHSAMRRLGLSHLSTCVWNKSNGGMGSLYRSKHEFVGLFKTGTAPHVNNVQLGKYGRYRTTVWDYAGVNTFRQGRAADLADHPTVKPTALVADAIRDVTHRGDLVLDPFGGSGTTLLAAEKTGRCARLIELDPVYVDVAVRRWMELTGAEPVLAATGQPFSTVKAERERDEARAEAEPARKREHAASHQTREPALVSADTANSDQAPADGGSSLPTKPKPRVRRRRPPAGASISGFGSDLSSTLCTSEEVPYAAI